MVWFFLNRNNTFSSSHLANNERTVSLLVVHCGLLSTLLQTIKIRQYGGTAAIFNMIVSACDSLSSSIFNLKIKFYARFSRFFFFFSLFRPFFYFCTLSNEFMTISSYVPSFWPITTLACEKWATETNCSKILNKEFSRINGIRFFIFIFGKVVETILGIICPLCLAHTIDFDLGFYIRFWETRIRTLNPNNFSRMRHATASQIPLKIVMVLFQWNFSSFYSLPNSVRELVVLLNGL